MIKAILFDMDGTLVDSERHYTDGTKDCLFRLGYHLSDEEIYGTIGKNLEQMNEYLSSLTNLSKEEINDIIIEYFTDINPIKYRTYLYEEVIEILERLKKKDIKMAICSGSQRILIEEFIKDCHLENIIDLYLSYEDVNSSKPDPGIYLKAMELLNLKKEECLIVEDSYEGILAAKKAGCYVYARDASKYFIDQSNADKIIKDLRELLEDIL